MAVQDAIILAFVALGLLTATTVVIDGLLKDLDDREQTIL